MTDNKQVEYKSKLDELNRALETVKREMDLNDGLVQSLKADLEKNSEKLETNGKLIASIKRMVDERKALLEVK